ncbi:MAG: bifunctional phosphopantothenoylcysteine decarboxylase/phosphopantothenate--cysteine ligase CoaBC [Nitrospinota bacterium]
MNELKGKTVILGVCGGIAAYKAAELTRFLKKDGADVWVVMTRNAKEFISPLTFEVLSGNSVYTNMFLQSSIFNLQSSISMPHIDLAKKCDILLIVPATANIIGKFASGIADDLLSTLYLSVKAPVLIAPAMNSNMYANPIVQENIKRLKGFDINFVEPESGELACGDIGEGRLAEPNQILKKVRQLLAVKKDLKGKTILITAGPTCEPIDPVRFISNPSSGKMGYAIARAAKMRGGDVVLISGPTGIPVPSGIKFISVSSAADMRREVLKEFKKSDISIMAAAVSDFTPENYSDKKIKKEGTEGITIKLKKNPDILSEITSKLRTPNSKLRTPIIIGFALETEDMIKNAKKKLKEKNLDLIVANHIKGFGSDFNRAIIIDRKGNAEDIPLMSKEELAEIILDRALRSLSEKG